VGIRVKGTAMSRRDARYLILAACAVWLMTFWGAWYSGRTAHPIWIATVASLAVPIAFVPLMFARLQAWSGFAWFIALWLGLTLVTWYTLIKVLCNLGDRCDRAVYVATALGVIVQATYTWLRQNRKSAAEHELPSRAGATASDRTG
jgi:hypothetical protein